MLDQLIENAERVGTDDELVVLGPKMRRDRTSVLQLVELRIIEADGESLHRPVRGLGHEPDNGARVDTPREERAKRDIADHVRANGVCHDAAQLLGGILSGATERFARIDLPERAHRGGAIVPAEQVSGRQLVDALEDRPVAGRIQE